MSQVAPSTILAAPRNLAARWRHRADRMEELLDQTGQAAPEDRARIDTLRLCANEVEPTPEQYLPRPQ